MKITNYSLSLAGASIIDVNPRYTQDNLPDRIPDGLALTNSMLQNLLSTTPGERARIFEPTFGSLWRHFIQEPIADITAKKMEIYMIQSIRKWIPQITLDQAATYILVTPELPGYYVNLVFSSPFAVGSALATFSIQV